MPDITPAILNAADQVETDLGALDVSTRALLQLLRAGGAGSGGGGGGSEIVVPRVGSGTAVDFAPKIAARFTPASDVDLIGLNDGNQNDITLVMGLWEDTDGSALIASSDPVSRVGGVHTARLASPVTLVSGKRYRIGWVATVSGNVRAMNSNSQSWTGFTDGEMYYGADTTMTRPGTMFASYHVPFDLVLQG